MIHLGDFNIDTRIVFALVWGLGTLLVWGKVFRKSLHQWRAFKDRRARGDFLSDGALFFVAVAAAVSIFFALFAQDGDSPLRILARAASALSLGMFTAAGVVRLGESPPEPPSDDTEGHWRR